MTNPRPLAEEQERLRQMARQELRTARQARSDVLFNPYANQANKAEANATWYAAINKAARDGILTPAQIQSAASLSRQRYWQITRSASPPTPPEVQLPETDL